MGHWKHRIAALACAGAVLVAPVVASAEPSATLRAQVDTLLGAPEYVPTASDWNQLGPDAAVVLRELALSPKTLVITRSRAVSSLAHFPSAETHAALASLVRDAKVYWMVRGKAGRTLAELSPKTAHLTLEPLLESDHWRTREAAVKALATTGTRESRQLLERRLDRESKPYLKTLIQRVLQPREGGSR